MKEKNEMNEEMQETTLEEWVYKLNKHHKARLEYEELHERLSFQERELVEKQKYILYLEQRLKNAPEETNKFG